jgi:hypothetical protein
MRRHTEPTFGSLKGAPWGGFARDHVVVERNVVVG